MARSMSSQALIARAFAYALLLAALIWSIGPHGPLHADAADAAMKKCDVTGKQLGPTSVDSLSVSGTTCAAGEKVVKAFYDCRTKNGVAGRCVKKVLGYACTEVRTTTPSQFTGKVNCKKKHKTVKHSYTQSTA